MNTSRTQAGSDARRKNEQHGDAGFEREAHRLLFAWIALIVLMLLSLGSAYLSLGLGNPVASIGIAFVKSAIVVWLFMQLNRASAVVRLALASGVGTLVLLASLVGVDYSTRASEPTVMQQPQQIDPLLEQRNK